ncbi:lysophospholipid acyltransferase family protein [Virgibacillus ndiopensis]|uniref:lysophospholipid acyltransferase family protein n=1 Tax=Virgibacillus ndiopensis TaxID=2004408 RepID=UPI000C068AC3|nr:lysophospholipid acyltransferase family protein [Virgibacillus ndiopensis]
MYYFAAYVLKIFLSLFGRVKAYQKENLPESSGYVIACTHTGWIDILWLGISVLPVKIHYMAKKELFQIRSLKWLMQQLNAFPVDRDNPGPSSIKVPRKLLSEGKVVGIFPSGTRTSEEVPLKRGAVTIAGYSKVPIVPVAYVGPNNFKDLFKRKQARIIFGEPIYLPQNMPRKEGMDSMMNVLNEELNNLQRRLHQ